MNQKSVSQSVCKLWRSTYQEGKRKLPNFTRFDPPIFMIWPPGFHSNWPLWFQRLWRHRYGAIGLTGYNVEANSIVIGSNDTTQPMPTDNRSVELELHNAGYKYAWIDPMQQFFHAKTKYSLCDLLCLGTRIPSTHYSLIFFLDRSGPLTFPSDIECQSPFDCKIKTP